MPGKHIKITQPATTIKYMIAVKKRLKANSMPESATATSVAQYLIYSSIPVAPPRKWNPIIGISAELSKVKSQRITVKNEIILPS